MDIHWLLYLSIGLSKEKDPDLLLEMILEAAMDLTVCDGGTLYIRTGDELSFRTMITKSLGIYVNGKDNAVDMPPVPLTRKNVCACCALDGELINLPDVYASERYDFSGAKQYDTLTGYRTKSMMAVPMENDYGDVIGVLQLINATSGGKTVAFDAEYETVIRSIASQAAICLTNMNYAAELSEQLDSFVKVMSEAIDARSPYNANHTRQMVKVGGQFIDWLSSTGRWVFSTAEKRQLITSIWLHDVGKLVIPLEIMDKETRLGSRLEIVEQRYKIFKLANRVMWLENRISDKEYLARSRALNEENELIHKANSMGFLDDSTMEQLAALTCACHEGPDGGEIPALTGEERDALMVRKGTLTEWERAIMENHVVMTERILSQMTFSRNYKKVTEWASAHHELLNGKGYPRKLAGESIPREVRLITIVDIYDALTARDRPYKPSMPPEKAWAALRDMAQDGRLDRELVELFIECVSREEFET
jgi:HD-GYP domain-containing protein (c-di-GMP phosphodiesterase class II)